MDAPGAGLLLPAQPTRHKVQEGTTFTTALAAASVIMRVWESRDICSRPFSLPLAPLLLYWLLPWCCQRIGSISRNFYLKLTRGSSPNPTWPGPDLKPGKWPCGCGNIILNLMLWPPPAPLHPGTGRFQLGGSPWSPQILGSAFSCGDGTGQGKGSRHQGLTWRCGGRMLPNRDA